MSAINNLLRWEDHPDYHCARREAEDFCLLKNAEGYTITEICEMLSVSDSFVRDIFKKRGVNAYYCQGITKSKRRKQKLTDEQVREIRANAHSTSTELSRIYKVNRSYISALRLGRHRKGVI